MRLACAVITLFATGRLAAQQGALSPRPYRPGVDVLDYALSLDLPDSGNRIEGRAVLTVRRTGRIDTLVLDLLPVFDNLDRTLEAARQAGETGALVQGVGMVQSQFLEQLKTAPGEILTEARGAVPLLTLLCAR